MRQWTGPVLVKVMACRLFGAKPLPELMLTYCQLDIKNQTSMKFEWNMQNFLFVKMHLKMSSAKWRRLFPGRN